jgi:microtubule-associated protein-like 6
MICSSQGPKDKILHLSASGVLGNNGVYQYTSVGEKHINVWKLTNGTLKTETVRLGKDKNKAFMSVTQGFNGTYVVGSSEGDLMIFNDKTLTISNVNHIQAVNALWSNHNGDIVVSGGRDGYVKIYKCDGKKLSKVTEFCITGFSVGVENISSHAGKPPPIRSVCLSSDYRRVLVGTQTCEILEFELKSGASFFDESKILIDSTDILPSNVVIGHWKDELWGLAIRPCIDDSGQEKEYCTVGDDGFLRIWNVKEHRQIRCLDMGIGARSCAFSPDGQLLAVGFGSGGGAGAGSGGKRSKKGKVGQGWVRVYRVDNIPIHGAKENSSYPALLNEIKESKQMISDIKFSPDGSILAVGSRDNSIYLYSVAQQFKRRGKLSKHNSGINQFDFSSDGKSLQSCCSAYEIIYSDVAKSQQILKGASELKDTQWATWTCTLGWPTLGIWKGDMDGTDINAVDRSPSGELLACADDFGKVKIFRYPVCNPKGTESEIYTGHSSHVTNVRWISENIIKSSSRSSNNSTTDDILISCGGMDKCVFQWRNTSSEASQGRTKKNQNSNDLDDIDVIELDFDLPSGGDEFTAVKPWLGAIVTPSAYSNPDPARSAQFFAALGEFSSKHKLLRQNQPEILKNPNGELELLGASNCCEEAHYAAKNCLVKSIDSGVSSSAAPDSDELELEWIHGFRGFDTRNNVRYFNNLVIYHAAALGVVLDPLKKTQRFFHGHTDDIMALTTYQSPQDRLTSMLVATGQQGKGNTFIWEVKANSIKTISAIKTNQRSVHMLEFSKDGRLIISIAEDKSIAISDWKSNNIIVNTKGEGGVTHDLTSILSSTNFSFVSCGDKHIKFWTLNGRNLTGNKISTSSKKGTSIQHFLCIVEINGVIIIGCEDGNLYCCSQKGVVALFSHHQYPGAEKKSKQPSVTSIYFENDLMVTGSKNGSICIWDVKNISIKNPNPKFIRHILIDSTTNKGKLPAANTVYVDDISAKQIQSICYKNTNDGILLLVSTRGCDMIEINCPSNSEPFIHYPDGITANNGILIRGHCNNELWGLSTHPLLPEYCTVGDDKTLRIFSVLTKNMLACVPLGVVSRSCCYSPDGNMIAVGFGGRLGNGKEAGGGIVRLYSRTRSAKNSEQVILKKVTEKRDAKQWIGDLKFSADGQTLAVGAKDCKVYIYNVVGSDDNTTLKLRKVFTKHSSVINHLDLSHDGSFMQSTDSAYELLFSDLRTGKQITSASELKDVKWDTWTSTLGWPVQGIWTDKSMDGSDINSVSRSNSGHLCATSDDFGKVNLFRYPCDYKDGALPIIYSGHSSHVTKVRWTAGDDCVISCGGNDKCIMQWRHTIIDTNNSGTEIENIDNKQDDEDDEDEDDLAASMSNIDKLMDGPGGGDESGCVKPWLGAIKTPKNPPFVSIEAPAATLNLSWIYGYTSGAAGASNSRISNNLYYNTDNDIIYPAAALGVKLSKEMNLSDLNNKNAFSLKQNYYSGHNDDILCLAMSSDRRFVATGQTASKSSKGKGSISVWDALECRELCRMDSCHQRGVVSLSFCPEGNQLLSVGLDDNNTHCLWTDIGGGWSRVEKSAENKSGTQPILFSKWVNPSNPMVTDGQYELLTGGAKSLYFWKIEGATIKSKSGRFGSKYKQAPILCVANLNTKDGWRLIAATSTGDLYVYEKREVINGVEKAHVGAILSLAESGNDCKFMVSGGKDGHIRVWNQALQSISSFDVSSFSVVDASVASIDICPFNIESNDESGNRSRSILVGTYGGEIMEISTEGAPSSRNSTTKTNHELDLEKSQVNILMYSHNRGELWGLATHPTNADIVATVGDDGTVRIWDIRTNIMLKCFNLGHSARSVVWHPSGTVLAVGLYETVKAGYSKKTNKSTRKKKPTKAGKGKEEPAKTATSWETATNDNIKEFGTVQLLSVNNLNNNNNNNSGIGVEIKRISVGCTSVAWINEVKFSPAGNLLICGSHDKRLYAYTIPDSEPDSDSEFSEWGNCLKSPSFVFNKHSSAVLHADFSLDGKYVQTNCQAEELLYLNPETGKQETSASKLADYNGQPDDDFPGRNWASQTCVLGWSVQGIWPPGANGSDINSVDRHINNKLIATADDFSQIKLFNYPCIDSKSKFNAYDGHSSHVTNTRWTIGDSLISVGGNDKCIFKWQLEEN